MPDDGSATHATHGAHGAHGAHAAPVEPPLGGRYPWVVAVAMLALAPNIVLTTAFALLREPIGADLRMSTLLTQQAEGISNAGYACGAVLASFLIQRFKQRKLFLSTEGIFVVGAVLAAAAWAPAPYFAGRVIQGFATGLMLVIALPPLITRYGVDRLPGTAAAVNIGLFGAVTVGPLLAGLVAATSWRIVFAAVAVAGTAGLVLGALALPDIDAFDRERSPDVPAFVLAGVATVLPFFAASQLVSAHFGDPLVWAPIVVGLVALIVLVVMLYRRKDPLMPVRALSTSLPVVGTLSAMVAGAAFVTLVELGATGMLQAKHKTPLQAGILSAPAIGGVAVAAIIFAAVLRTRYLPLLVLSGMLLIAAGGFTQALTSSDGAALASSALLGAGAGAAVSPGLFLAGFGVPSNKVGRAFALVELLRSESAYLVGPILLYVASLHRPLANGLRFAAWITLAFLGIGLLVIVALFISSGARLHPPDLDAWLKRGEQAMESPPTAQRVQNAVKS